MIRHEMWKQNSATRDAIVRARNDERIWNNILDDQT